YAQLGQQGLLQEKIIVFCVDDTHAALFAQELRRISGDPDYAARITRSERNSHQLERNFQEIGRSKPRVAVTVELLSTGFDATGVSLYIAGSERFVCLADGRKIPFDEYCQQSKEVIRKISPANLQELLNLWAPRDTRNDVREELKSNDVHVAAFRHYFDLNAA